MSTSQALTVGVITKDAGDDLPGLLESLPPEVELVVADGGSEDETVQLSREAGAIVIEQDQEAIRLAGGNFDVARNGIIRIATSDWILFLDADERLTVECREEISAVLSDRPSCSAYDIPRINLYWGRPVRLLGHSEKGGSLCWSEAAPANGGRWPGWPSETPDSARQREVLAGPCASRQARCRRRGVSIGGTLLVATGLHRTAAPFSPLLREESGVA
jgi:hypothetical protein